MWIINTIHCRYRSNWIFWYNVQGQSPSIPKVTTKASGPHRRTDTEWMLGWRNEIVPLRTTESSPPPRGWKGLSMIGRWYWKISYDWLSWKTLWPFALPPARGTTLRAFIIVSYDQPPSPPFSSSFAITRPLKKGYVPDNGTEPIRLVRENELTRPHWSCASV